MSEERLQRLEDKVDKVKDDVHELKTDFKIHTTEMANKMQVFGDHITGDQKIINEISPLMQKLPDLVEIVKEYQYEKETKRRKREKIKTFMTKAGMISIVVGILAGLKKIFS